MLQKMRQSAKSGFSYILVGVLIVIFAVSFGAPTDGCNSGNANAKIATVAGNKIGNDELNVVYNRYFGGRQADDEQINLQRAASLRMVTLTYLLAEKARQAGLRVSDEEFRNYIMDPNRNIEFRFAYGQSGQFDGPFYKAYVQNQLRVSLPKYEEYKREELLARKYIALIDMQVNVTPQEIEEFNKLRNTEVNLEFVRFSADSLKDSIQISDADVQKFIADNKAEITKNFDENRSKYEEPEQVQLRRIFIAKPEDAAQLAEATKRFDDAKRRINDEKQNFADVAGEVSEDYAKQKQGLMDWSTLDNLDQTIAKAIEGKPAGSVVEVDTDYAFMLVKVEDRKDAQKTPIEDVQDEIARALLQEKKVSEIANKMANELLEKAKTTDSLQAALASFQTENTGDSQDETGASAANTNPWNALSVGTTGMFSQEGQDMSAMFGSQFPGLNLGRSPWDRIPDIGKSPELAKDAFKLTDEKPLAEKVYTSGDAKIVARLKERKNPETDLDPKAQAELADEARQAKASNLLGGAVGVLIQPSEDYGPWLEGMFKQAVKDKSIKLNSKQSPVAARVQMMAQPAPALSVELNSGSDS